MTPIPEAWSDPERTPLDFIVVGSGAGGAPLAARLAERGYTVLVVEMGCEKPPRPPAAKVENTEVPLLHTETTEDPRHSLRFFVQHFDRDPAGSLDPKVHRPPAGARRDEEGIFYPRAKGVGGCTIHNAMITIVGRSEDWDEIAEATGDESWRGERMRAYFERVEHCRYDRPTLWSRLKGLLGFGTGWEGARHGHRGWLHTTLSDLRFLKRDRQLFKVVLGGALGALRGGAVRFGELARFALSGRLFPRLDPNHWETARLGGEGLARIPCAVTPTGERSSPRERLLAVRASDSPHRERLHLLAGAFVTDVILADDPGGGAGAGCRATGVRCLLREHVYEADMEAAVTDPPADGDLVRVHCRREVVLAGGAFNTPQLLMLSGIGPKDHLTDRAVNAGGRIHFRVDLPGVGKNLQDRYEVPVVATTAGRFRSLDGLMAASDRDDPGLRQWVGAAGRPAFRRGLYATNGGLIGLFVRSGQEDAAPDLFIFALAGYFPGYHLGYSRPEALNRIDPARPNDRRALTWLILKARTRHRGGEVRLRDDHPFRRPRINFRSFPNAPDAVVESNTPTADQDLEALHQGVQLVRGILDIGIDQRAIESQELPGIDGFGGNVRKWIKNVAWGHHACGTCRMGSADDPYAVVDSRFRVRGVAGLRVVDASVFPRIPGFFIVANVYMIAEKAADVITEDHPLRPEDLPPEVRDALRRDPVLGSSPEFEARRVYPAALEEAEARLINDRRRRAGLTP